MEDQLLDVALGRIVVHDGSDRQYIYLCECDGTRGFPIVIGNSEAGEIQRVVIGVEPERPLTHQLLSDTVTALGHQVLRVDIVDLKHNTFYAQLVIGDAEGAEVAHVDARPSDAIAIALRAGCKIRVAERVLGLASSEDSNSKE